MRDNRNEQAKWVLICFMALIVGVVLGMFFWNTASADAFFPTNCTWLNDCDTFDTDMQVVAVKGGFVVKGTIPVHDASTSGNPIEVIITDGDVFTRCANKGGVTKITGKVYYRGVVQAGWFEMFFPATVGETLTITAYWGQQVCANCPNAVVETITITDDDPECVLLTEYVYTIHGNFKCVSEPITKGYGGGSWAMNRMSNPSYTSSPAGGWCHLYNCDGGVRLLHVPSGKVTVEQISSCYQIKLCTACVVGGD